MEKKSKELEWFKRNKNFLSIYEIEKDINIPSSTLAKWVKGVRDLPENWHPVLISWIKAFKK